MSTAASRENIRFGKYRLIDRIAVGGMAEIFLAHQVDGEGLETPVVIKRIRPHLSKHSTFVKMFLNEARLAAQLNHPNIVQIHDLGKIGESYFIAMEYIFGRDMRRIIPKAEAAGDSVPAGVRAAHRLGRVRGAALRAPEGGPVRQPAEHRSPGRDAREHLRVLRRHREGAGLRHRQGRQPGGADARWRAQGEAQLHEPGAVPGQAAGLPQRHLLAWAWCSTSGSPASSSSPASPRWR